ncbi:trehalase-like isoform X1 [Amphiura filiformis]|uniref:trehalase-like isoform X1 n=1 Tax=Amphiura filiformis TaxID=82378 RepID=UPI003B21D512
MKMTLEATLNKQQRLEQQMSVLIDQNAKLIQAFNEQKSIVERFFATNCIGRIDRVAYGSIHIFIRFSKREQLDNFWQMYKTGLLKNELTRIILARDEDRAILNLKVSADEAEYERGIHHFSLERFPTDPTPQTPEHSGQDSFERNIFCDGKLLDAVQGTKLFDDSKTFVDMHLKRSPEETLAAFDAIDDPWIRDDQGIPRVLHDFVSEYFEEPGTEFEQWIPDDWKERPAFLSIIKDGTLRDWAGIVHSLWKKLGRKVISEISLNPEQYSLIYVDKPFIIPGERFREQYYWDTYWIIKGLLVSGMTQTVRGMLSNFVDLVKRFGFVPNGNRIYYTNRSQPPLLIPSVYEYYKATNDLDFVKDILPALEEEYKFWVTKRSVDVVKPGCDRTYKMCRYKVETDKPRPESYREDMETASCNKGTAAIYAHITSTAESGWNFSSRWCQEGCKTLLTFVCTTDILPVDLNSFLCLNEKLLAKFFDICGETTKRVHYHHAYLARRQAIQDIFWVEEAGAWFDFDLQTQSNRYQFYLSNITPLWIDSFDDTVKHDEGSNEVAEKVIAYLEKSDAFIFPGGVPTSQQNTGEQWDFPNAWPPLQDMLITALDSTSLPKAKELAFQIAQKWITTNWRVYQTEDFMFEKYDVEKQASGHGGEFTSSNQVGFGWTNGVVLSLLDKYGDRLKAET